MQVASVIRGYADGTTITGTTIGTGTTTGITGTTGMITGITIGTTGDRAFFIYN
jgi:hypothetical protein